MEDEEIFPEGAIESNSSDVLATADDLYVLMKTLFVDGDRSRHARRQLGEISVILERTPLLANNLYKWNFLTNELLLTLYIPSTAAMSIEILIRIISIVKKLPEFFLTKKFLFFVTEKLYSVIKTKRDGSLVSISHPVTEKQVLSLVTEMISVDRSILNALWDVGFFTLLNGVTMSLECCRLYNSIFTGIYHYTILDHINKGEYTPEVLYEIQRKHFDAEIIFKEKDIIELKRHVISYNKGIYEKIYQKCANITHIIDLSVKDTYGLMLYKRSVFMNDDLDLLIREKCPKAIKIYRRSLEDGAIPSVDYVTPLVQALDDVETRMDAAIALYYLVSVINNYKGFTEPRIRSIFECLEYHCEPECDVRLKRLEYERAKLEISRLGNGSLDNISVNSDLFEKVSQFDFTCTNIQEDSNSGDVKALSVLKSEKGFVSCKAGEILDSLKTPADVSGREITAGTESETGIGPEPEININRCNRIRLLRLIVELYGAVERSFFYKPSYLILMRAQMGHCFSEVGFINSYFTDFLDYTATGRLGLARVLFPVQGQKRAARVLENKREVLSGLGLLDGLSDAALPSCDWNLMSTSCNDDENLEMSHDLNERLSKMVSSSKMGRSVKKIRNMILSESEEEGNFDVN